MASVSAVHNMNNQTTPQQYFLNGKAPIKHKAAMKRKAIAAGMETSVKKAKKYGAGAKALVKSLKTARPLNSWIAYRSFYHNMFTNIQQKDISTILRHLWQLDPFKAKWAILAKAFSVIRDDKGKKDASLDIFLAISAPFVDIVQPTNYLAVMGFQLTIVNNQATLSQQPAYSINTISRRLLTTTRSVSDVVDNCYSHGYFTEIRTDVGPSNTQGAMIMATNTQAFPVHVDLTPEELSLSVDNEANGEDGKVGTQSEKTGENTGSDGQESAQPAIQNSVFGTTLAATGFESSGSNMAQSLVEPDNGIEPNLDVFPDLTMAMIDESFGDFPYNQAFDPNATETYVFDPFNAYGFNAVDMNDLDDFNIDDWVHEEVVIPENLLDDSLFPGAPFN